jgi:hypothetical protein
VFPGGEPEEEDESVTDDSMPMLEWDSDSDESDGLVNPTRYFARDAPEAWETTNRETMGEFSDGRFVP